MFSYAVENFLLVFLEDILLRDLPVKKHLGCLIHTLLVIGSLLRHGISKGALIVIVIIYLVVLDEHYDCALSVAGGLELVYSCPSGTILCVITYQGPKITTVDLVQCTCVMRSHHMDLIYS